MIRAYKIRTIEVLLELHKLFHRKSEAPLFQALNQQQKHLRNQVEYLNVRR